MSWLRWSPAQIARETGHPLSRVRYALRQGYVVSAKTRFPLVPELSPVREARFAGEEVPNVKRWRLTPAQLGKLMEVLEVIGRNSKRPVRDRLAVQEVVAE